MPKKYQNQEKKSMKKPFFWFILFVFIVCGFSLVNSLRQFPKIQQRLKEAELKVEALKLKNWQLKQEKEYRETPEFLEKEIRDKLMMGKEGEWVVILPKELRVSSSKVEAEEKKEEKPIWRQWWELFN